MSPIDLARDALDKHKQVEIEPSDTICGECSYQLPNGRYFGKVVEWPCEVHDTAAAVVRAAKLADELEREAEAIPALDDSLDENYRTAARIRDALEGGEQ